LSNNKTNNEFTSANQPCVWRNA